MSAKPKNVLFIMADQLPAAMLGCYGSGVASTPVLDALAEEGVRFDRCYASTPICAPNRANCLTGRSPCVHGMMNNNYALAADAPTYAHVLKAHGYRTGGFGKFHQHPMPMGLPEDVAYLGFDESILSEDPKWGPWQEWVAREHPEHADTALGMAWGWGDMQETPETRQRNKILREKHIVPAQQKSPWSLTYTSPLPHEAHDTTFITELGLDFMRRHAASHPEKAFFCHVSYVDPHDPYDPPEPYASMFKAEDMVDATPAAWMPKGVVELEKSRDFFGGQREALVQSSTVRELRAKFHGSLKFLDDQIGRLVTYLKENNLWEDTILVFTTDHGDMLGDQELMTKGVKHYDKGVRCPLLVAGGGVIPAVVDDLVCTLDFFPTFADWCCVPEDMLPPLEGQSFAPVCAGGVMPKPWPEILISYLDTHTVITADGWRLTRYAYEEQGQMFNLREDPDEQHDLYEDPSYADVRQRLLEGLVRAMGRPSRLPHYRNLPVMDGRKYVLGGAGNTGFRPGPPLYALGQAPALWYDTSKAQ